jgi:membrane protease YdiL (CAAX protease family)
LNDPRTSEPAGGPGSLLAFFIATYALTWACYIAVAAWLPVASAPGRTLVMLGTITPSIVALSLTALGQGRPGVRALIGRIAPGPVAARWFLFAVGYMAAVKLVAALILRFSTGAWPRFGETPLYVIPFAIAFSTPVQGGEEIGWRGFALPRMEARFGLAPASILLGLIWATWHLPLFFVRGADTFGQSFPVYTLQVIAISVTMAWFWARTGRTLLPVMLLHAAINNTKDIDPSATPGAADTFGWNASPVAWVTVALLWAFAAGCLMWMARPRNPGA